MSEPDSGSLPYSPDLKHISNKVLAVAWTLFQKSREVVFVSQDENLRTKADILNVPTICYQGNRLDDAILYSGMHRYEVDKQKLRRLAKQSSISKEEVFSEQQQMEEINPNEGLLLSSSEAPDKEVVIPVCILEELDCIKMNLGEKGRSAQIITRMLDECRKLGSIS